MFKRFWSSRAAPPLQNQTSSSLSALTEEILSGRKAAADINIKHNFAVQRFSRAPYDLKTNVVVVSHAEGFLATLEWRWNDPGRGGKTIVAVTSGINANRKLAISDACRAMLTKQKLIEKTDSAKSDALKEVQEFMSEGHFAHACKALLQAVMHSGVSLDSIAGIFTQLWRKCMAQHDGKLAEVLISVLEKSQGVSPQLFESLVQEMVFISNQGFAESVLLSLQSDRVRVLPPDRGFVSDKTSKISEIEKWKFWRCLMAIEELANIHASLNGKDQLVSIRMHLDSASLPLIKLRGFKKMFVSPDSLVLLSALGDASICLTAKVIEASSRPDGEVCVTVSLLTEESNNLLFRESEVDMTILSESRVTFERIAQCLREFYRVSQIPDLSCKFTDSMRKLLVSSEQGWKLEKSPSPDLTREKRYLNLSEAQVEAVLQSLAHPLSLIHGPAGTGKTHTLCGIVSAWQASGLDTKILCCADSNTAADNIFNALKRKGFEAFRFGTWKAVSDVPEEVLSVLPNKNLVEKYRSNCVSAGGGGGYLVGLRKQIEEEALKHFKIVVTTLSSSRHPSMDKVIFPHVIIDESAQTTEPAALLAISHGCEKLVLIGDHKQLPAVILSKQAQRLGLNVSLFERLISEGTPPPSVLLNVQRRMHPSIAEWPSKAFYENKLDSGEPLFTMLPSAWTLLGQSKRVVFVDTDGIGGGEERQGTSTRNLGESKVLINVVSRLVDSGISAEKIGVIVPYLAQKALVQKNIKLPGLWVNTVEGFQGHEKDFIVISTTRSNTVGSIGFLDDERRMNVMLTRAKQGLVVVGDKHTLKKRSNGKWADWFNWCESHGSVIHHHSI